MTNIERGLNLPPDKRGCVEIPDCGRDDLPEFFVDIGFKVGVEIGTSRGWYAEKLCKAGLKLHCIDPWISYDDYYGGTEKAKAFLERYYNEAKQRLSSYDCVLHRKYSMDAVREFEDESLDFVYLDANHEFKYIAEDLWAWSKKVRRGGIISGHDFFYSGRREYDKIHEKYVIPAWTSAYKIKPWYVLGRRDKKEGEARDPFRSYMWFKQ